MSSSTSTSSTAALVRRITLFRARLRESGGQSTEARSEWRKASAEYQRQTGRRHPLGAEVAS